MSAKIAFWRNRIGALGCVVCRRHGSSGTKVELHHVAEGSGKRSEFAIAPLCAEHHRGSTGFHGMGERAFCALFRLPGENEFGLLIWTMEDLASLDLAIEARRGWRR